MKSLARKFRQIEKKNPLFSSYTCFALAVMGQEFSREIIGLWFYELVEKDDYAKNEARAILSHLESFSNTSEDRVKLGQLRSRSDSN